MQRESRSGGRPLDPSDSSGRTPDEPARASDYDEILQRYSDQAILTADPSRLTATQRGRRAALLAARREERVLLAKGFSQEDLALARITRDAQRRLGSPVHTLETILTGARSREVGARREPTTCRPRRAGRAETARMAAMLPSHARIDIGMTSATIRVYSSLWRLADEGRHDPSVAEIAERALCDVRTAQLAIAALQKSGHLAVTYRQVRRGMNIISVYRLAYHRDIAPTPAAGGEISPGVKNGFTPLRKESVVTTSGVAEECSSKRSAPRGRAESDHEIAPCKGSARKLRTIPGRAAAPARHRAGFDPDIGRLALVSLKAQGVADEFDADDCDAICAAVDGLRRQRFSGFSPGFWERSVSRLRFRAYLAVIEVAEIAAVKQIHDMAAYLGGVLRKPVDEVRPEVTLTRLQYSAAA